MSKQPLPLQKHIFFSGHFFCPPSSAGSPCSPVVTPTRVIRAQTNALRGQGALLPWHFSLCPGPAGSELTEQCLVNVCKGHRPGPLRPAASSINTASPPPWRINRANAAIECCHQLIQGHLWACCSFSSQFLPHLQPSLLTCNPHPQVAALLTVASLEP